jgi:hypothetical protein
MVFILAQSTLSRKGRGHPKLRILNRGMRMEKKTEKSEVRHPQSAFRNLVQRLDTRPRLWNIETNDPMTDGRVPEDLPATFCT